MFIKQEYNRVHNLANKLSSFKMVSLSFVIVNSLYLSYNIINII